MSTVQFQHLCLHHLSTTPVCTTPHWRGLTASSSLDHNNNRTWFWPCSSMSTGRSLWRVAWSRYTSFAELKRQDRLTQKKMILWLRNQGYKLEFKVSWRSASPQVTFSFKNPLDTPLTNCHLSVDGSGLMRPRSIAIEGDVDPEGQFTYTMRFRPRIHGDRKIIASFYSKELIDINGVKSFTVKKQ